MRNRRRAVEILNKASDRIERKEKQLLNKKEPTFIKEQISPITNKIASRIPKQMDELFQKAFESGFSFLFEKGTPLIEKSYQTENAAMKYEINQFILEKSFSKKNLRRFRHQANRSIMKNQVLSSIEGSVLGFFGIGLPDIPIFLSLILKSIYEIALSYGFEYHTRVEQMYIMSVLCASLTSDDEQRMFAKQCDLIGSYIDENIQYLNYNIDEMIKVTSRKLASQVVFSKFIQGLPVVGISGGISNLSLLSKITGMANIKYQKRFLVRTQKLCEV